MCPDTSQARAKHVIKNREKPRESMPMMSRKTTETYRQNRAQTKHLTPNMA